MWGNQGDEGELGRWGSQGTHTARDSTHDPLTAQNINRASTPPRTAWRNVQGPMTMLLG